jgi:hypothetical protein
LEALVAAATAKDRPFINPEQLPLFTQAGWMPQREPI